jgi:hypothetical protein
MGNALLRIIYAKVFSKASLEAFIMLHGGTDPTSNSSPVGGSIGSVLIYTVTGGRAYIVVRPLERHHGKNFQTGVRRCLGVLKRQATKNLKSSKYPSSPYMRSRVQTSPARRNNFNCDV